MSAASVQQSCLVMFLWQALPLLDPTMDCASANIPKFVSAEVMSIHQ